MPAETAPPPARPQPPRSPRRRLDRRTVGISLLIALIAALGAGLLASVLRDDHPSDASRSDPISLVPAAKVDTAKALGTRLLAFDGRETTLRSGITAGTPAVVNFFSTTCTPCITEMPALERVHRERRDVSFIGIDVQDSVPAGRALIKRTGISYDALRDPPGDLLRTIGGVGLPTTVLIDAKGRVVATHTGALTASALGTLIDDKFR